MFMVVIGTFAWQSISTLRRVPYTDAIVMILVTIVTVMSDLAIAVVVGVIVSALAYAWNNATRIHARTEIKPDGTKVYQIEGPLFFGSSAGFMELFTPTQDPESVVVDFSNSRVVDHSALQAIENLALKYEALDKTLQLRGLSRDCHRLLNRAGQLVVDSDTDPEYGLAVDYSIRTGTFGARALSAAAPRDLNRKRHARLPGRPCRSRRCCGCENAGRPVSSTQTSSLRPPMAGAVPR